MTEFRESDTRPEERVAAVAARRGEGRSRTVMWAILAAGCVSLFFGWANDRDQRERSVKNCQVAQNVSRVLAEVADNVAKEAPTSDVRERWENYERTFRESFPPQGRSCHEIFPAVDVIPFNG